MLAPSTGRINIVLHHNRECVLRGHCNCSWPTCLHKTDNIVVCIAVAMQRSWNGRLYLMRSWGNGGNGVLSTRSAPSCYKEKDWGNQLSWALLGRLRRDGAIVELTFEFCMGCCDRRTRAREESPLLEAVTREQLVKTERARKFLAGAVTICELWRLTVAL
jgi:hypothetical protein